MKYSKPIIASNRGALPELIKDGVNGFIFDFDNFDSSLQRAIENLKNIDLHKMGKASNKLFNEKFCSNKMYNEINKIYGNLLKNSFDE